MTGTVVVLAIVVQFLVEIIKKPIPAKQRVWSVPLIALGFALALTVGTKIGILSLYGFSVNPPILDYILTGVVISGGSVGVNELFKVLQGLKENLQINLPDK